MGIDFSLCDAHWGYGGFHRFRGRLANEIGINLDEMAGFLVNGDPWDVIKDPIKDLLDHSDCDGYLTPRQCRKIYPRLLELIKDWSDDDYDKKQGNELANGMKKAAMKFKKLEFC
jgi:hypothetical protein